MYPRSDVRFRSALGSVSWALRQRNLDAHRTQPTLHRKLNRIARFELGQRPDHRLPLADPLQVDRGDDIADLQTHRVRRASLDDSLDVKPLFHRERPLGNDRVGERHQLQTEKGVVDRSLGDQLLSDASDRLRRYREEKPLSVNVAERVDADNSPTQSDQGPPGVPRVDGGIVLDQV